ncbi:MAG: hypothetical protein FWF80_01520, partial [Defluviitaleaceae bacterium]|nr:hypothetical protein [Defluviitaleaceae bacterium]
MSKVKNRKRLSLLAIVFLLAFLAAAAFAFLPGMLDVVGRVGIREGDYVQWVFAATQAAGDSAVVGRAPTAASLGDPLAPGVIRTGFTHTTMAGEVAAAHLGTPAGTGRPAAFEISGNPDPVYL